MFQPLTKEQYDSAINAGFTHEEIVQMETKRKADNTPPPPSYLSRVGSEYKKAGKNIVTNIEEAYQDKGILSGAKKVAETALQGAGDIASATFAPITAAVAPVVTPIVSKIASIPGISAGIHHIQSWADQHPEAAKNLEAVFNLGTLGAGGAAEKPVVEAGINAAGKTLEGAGAVLKGTGERAYRIAAPMEQTTAKAVQAYQASKPTLLERVFGTAKDVLPKPVRESETAARAGLTGTEWRLGVNAKRASDNIWTKHIAPALESSQEKVNIKTFIGDLKKKVITENADLSRRKALLDALDAVRSDFKKVNDVSLSKLQDYKEGWAKFVPERAYKGKPIAGALNEVRNMAAQKARAIIYSKLGPEIKRAYLDYGNLQSIIESGIKSIDPLRSKGLTKQIWEEVLDKGVTPVATYGGKILYRTGQGLELIGKKGAQKIRDLLYH